VGAPHIWNGDEMGMTGADDPDNRKPLIWPDISFEEESASTLSKFNYKQKPLFDKAFFAFYQSLIQLRKRSKAFSLGEYSFVQLPEDRVLAYQRSADQESYLVLFNNQDRAETIEIPIEFVAGDLLFSVEKVQWNSSKRQISLPPFGGAVLEKKAK
ncbi:MAG: alpha-glucosidase C-terminal domain-containing protein, partial [Saprospiraceae bacterium]|nr:alpha-glucosidase C-terminal domain-containing protein [Saprospiraceae bacterium]